MKRRGMHIGILLMTVAMFFIACQSTKPADDTSGGLAAPEKAPGTIEDKSNPNMAKVMEAHAEVKPADDEIVIYYFRPDGKYDEWGYWLWNFPGGDGALMWDRSQHLKVAKGVGYFRFKKNGSDIGGVELVGPDGFIGLIPRKDADWTKDGEADRAINTNLGNFHVVFANDQKSHPLGKYVPTMDQVKYVTKKTILANVSGKHALTPAASDNGFSIKSLDGAVSYKILDVENPDSEDRNANYTKKILFTIEGEADLAMPMYLSHPSYLEPVLVSSAALGASLADAMAPAADYKMGAIYDAANKSVEFRLWTPFASKVAVRLYKKSLAKDADFSMELSKDAKTGVWSGVFKDADPDGMFYEYSVFFGASEKIVLDPYAKSMDAFTNIGLGRAAVINPAKALPAGGWEGYEDVKIAQREDAIVYEVSVRDFTINPNSGVKNKPGTFLAFIEKLPYLKSLGVTHIQLMPVMNFFYGNELKQEYEATGTSNNNNYNWGYDPHNYFSPEGWYASDPADPYKRVVELKTLVKEAHKLGMAVTLDAVYNHTANTRVFDEIVPGYYYRLDPQGKIVSRSGCGNDTASDRVMVRKLIVDSIRMWVEEYKIDGFRFDLMGITDAETMLKAHASAAAVPGKDDVLFLGEGWKGMYTGPSGTFGMDQNYMLKTDAISVFNDEIRDALKGGGMNDKRKAFISNMPIATSLIFNNLIGKPQVNFKSDDPGDSVVYVECHDNLTMHDNISFNVGLKPSDPVQRKELVARLRLGNFFVLTSQGVAFIHAGQESGRSKPKMKATSEIIGEYLHNTYDSADNINQFEWKPLQDYVDLRDFTAGMIGIRKANKAFRLGNAKAIEAAAKQIAQEDPLSMGWTIKTDEGTFVMLVNANPDIDVDFADVGLDLSGAKVLVDSDEANKDGVKKASGFSADGSSVNVEPLTAVMFKK